MPQARALKELAGVSPDAAKKIAEEGPTPYRHEQFPKMIYHESFEGKMHLLREKAIGEGLDPAAVIAPGDCCRTVFDPSEMQQWLKRGGWGHSPAGPFTNKGGRMRPAEAEA